MQNTLNKIYRTRDLNEASSFKSRYFEPRIVFVSPTQAVFEFERTPEFEEALQKYLNNDYPIIPEPFMMARHELLCVIKEGKNG